MAEETQGGSGSLERQALIELVIAAELERQTQGEAHRVDITAMAEAIESALAASEPASPAFDDGRRPEELNATNDD